MTTITYYFDAYDTDNPGTWDTDPANVVDGNIATHGRTNDDGDYITLTSNTYNSEELDDITKVEIRTMWGSNGPDCVPTLVPIFTAGEGDGHAITTSDTSDLGVWTDYVDITNDTNAPVTWTQSDIEDMTMRIDVARTADRINIFKVEIRVTYGWTPYTNYEDVQRKAGTGASAVSNTEAVINEYLFQVEGYINSVCRFNFSDVYDDLNNDVKGLLNDTASNLAAIYVILYDMSGITSRVEAEDRINVLRDSALKNIQMLKDKKVTDFVREVA